ncbi:hypothetical protein BDA99DRAFT_527261 [Phascolomyces articulosus]|uniref:2-phosphoglycerate kinase n=1 Tax=Phascolomyces articulosus TaxID=60185 RepID=A0AAD5JNM6_9FUNG|nr:hypothetical protein BDA99DRAFT_527261 [Phascolomyces articulosus]
MNTNARQWQRPKNTSSKYDFVKVRVHLPNEHYYVLSRFLLSRMLTAARIDYGHALRIALDLKKRLVEKSQLDVSQKDLQKELFGLLKQHGYGEAHVQWYKTLENFYHQRIPLIVFIAGTASTGKSTVATQLSERLNLSSVLKTDVIYDLMHTVMDGKTPRPLWTIEAGRDQTFQDIVTQECSIVCKGLDGDLGKSIMEGKSIIIEGSLVDHNLLDHMYKFINKLPHQHTVIVAPFLLVLSEPELKRNLLGKETWFERAREFQSNLIHTNNTRKHSNLPAFHTMVVNMENIQPTIDVMQSIVLEQIAKKT